MDADLIRLIREQYPFPIAHAYKKTRAVLDDDAQKLKGREPGPVLRMLLADAMRPIDTQLATLEGHADMVHSAQFSSDGTRVMTASGDSTAKVWDVRLETRSPAEIAALVRCRVPWRLDEGRLLPTTPDATACPPRSAAR